MFAKTSRKLPQAIRAGALGLSLLLGAGCYGPFQLTRKLYQWNAQAGDKWPQEFMFLVLTWVPVYGVATLADAIVFNSIEFWTGNNPVESAPSPKTKHVARHADSAALTYIPLSEGGDLFIKQFQQGKAAGSLHVQKRQSMAVGLDEDGHVLLSAQTLADGSILVRDGHGKQMASYSADQVEQMLGSTASFTRK